MTGMLWQITYSILCVVKRKHTKTRHLEQLSCLHAMLGVFGFACLPSQLVLLQSYGIVISFLLLLDHTTLTF